jgi:hypothetical protein
MILVNVFSMAYLYHHNNEFIVFDQIKYSEITMTDSIFFLSGYFLAARWARIEGEGAYLIYDSLAVFQRNLLNLLGGGAFDRDPIICHFS